MRSRLLVTCQTRASSLSWAAKMPARHRTISRKKRSVSAAIAARGSFIGVSVVEGPRRLGAGSSPFPHGNVSSPATGDRRRSRFVPGAARARLAEPGERSDVALLRGVPADAELGGEIAQAALVEVDAEDEEAVLRRDARLV